MRIKWVRTGLVVVVGTLDWVKSNVESETPPLTDPLEKRTSLQQL